METSKKGPGSTSRPAVPVKGSLDYFFKKTTPVHIGPSSRKSDNYNAMSKRSISNTEDCVDLTVCSDTMVEWDCEICTLSNSKHRNSSGWYECEACAEPFCSISGYSTPVATNTRRKDASSSLDAVISIDDNPSPVKATTSTVRTTLCRKRPASLVVTPFTCRKRKSHDVIELDLDDEEGVEVEVEVEQAEMNKQPSFAFAISHHSGRIMIHYKGSSTLVSFALDDVVTEATTGSLFDARVQKKCGDRKKALAIEFETAGIDRIVDEVSRGLKVFLERSFTIDLKSALREFVTGYLRLRAVEQRMIRESGRVLSAQQLAPVAAQLLYDSSSKSADNGCLKRYCGGAKELAAHRVAEGTATELDQAVLDGKACAWCSSTLTSAAKRAKSVYCSQACAEEGRVRRGGMFASVNLRSSVFALENGVCSLCGLNAHQLFLEVLSLHPAQRLNKLLSVPQWQLPKSSKALDRLLNDPKEGNFWQVDHIEAVAEGGGGCGLENLRTLCVPCHNKETAKLHCRLKLAGKRPKDTTSEQPQQGKRQLDLRGAFRATAQRAEVSTAEVVEMSFSRLGN